MKHLLTGAKQDRVGKAFGLLQGKPKLEFASVGYKNLKVLPGFAAVAPCVRDKETGPGAEVR